ncbi:AAA family ATPase [Alteribacillus iranensis]|uniref:MoxR-like ATPase n=1 Tax=Alteribacillus iranensis TaxID=930128 RepID=A0A1I2B9B2_9BACI|nr:MoxR family ATPase [Alteribacillus iranensis]SFE52754.1 MoxR-like ATPase [Alteribacillus iranensis]
MSIQDGIRSIEEEFDQHGYITDHAVAISLHLVKTLQKPLLIEGPAGVGKTELAKVLARSLNTKLIRLQCYEGLDAAHAMYEWNYAKQMLHIQMRNGTNADPTQIKEEIFSEDFLLTRPLLQALKEEKAPVLLIDEIDRADEEFEAFLLEMLAEFQISIPELGTIRANERPYIILTSNRTRELSDALRRRCLYQWVDYPDFEKETAMIKKRFPDISAKLADQIAAFMQKLRTLPLAKIPGGAESLDWAESLLYLHVNELDKEIVTETLGCFIKGKEDWKTVEAVLEEEELLHP